MCVCVCDVIDAVLFLKVVCLWKKRKWQRDRQEGSCSGSSWCYSAHTNTHTHTRTHTCTQTFTCVHTRIHWQTHVCIHACTHPHPHIHICLHTHLHTYTHLPALTHTDALTHLLLFIPTINSSSAIKQFCSCRFIFLQLLWIKSLFCFTKNCLKSLQLHLYVCVCFVCSSSRLWRGFCCPVAATVWPRTSWASGIAITTTSWSQNQVFPRFGL